MATGYTRVDEQPIAEAAITDFLAHNVRKDGTGDCLGVLLIESLYLALC